MLASQLLLVQFFSEVLLRKAEPAVCAIATEASIRASNAIVMINFRIMGLPPHDHGEGKLDHKVRQALRFV
jgi:hypothetical protein